MATPCTPIAVSQPEMLQVSSHRQSHLFHDALSPPDQAEGAIPYTTINAAYDYTSPSDPYNPRNFSPLRTILTLTGISLLAFLATTTGAIYAPAQDAVAAEFGVSHEVSVLPLALYNTGLAFGPMIGAPLSETYGRKAVFVVATPVFAASTLGAGFAGGVAALTVTRFFAGMFAAPLINNAPAVILDSTDGRYRGVSLGMYYTLPQFGAAVGPLVGGFIVQGPGWRWTQWMSAVATVTVFIPMCFVKETYKKVILKRRAVELGIQDSSSQRTSAARAFRYFATVLILRPVHMLLTEPIVTLVSVYNGFLFGLMYTFVVAMPWVFGHYYGWSVTGQSLSFLGSATGALLAAVPLCVCDLKYYQPRLTEWQRTHAPDDPLPPEKRLTPGMIGSLLLPIALFIVAWTAHYHTSPFVPVVFQGVVMFSSLLIYASANLFMLDAYGPLYGASASGAMMLIRYAFSAGFPLFALQMYEKMGVGWATSLLGFITLCMAPIHWVFWYFGETLRARSRYESSL